VGQINLYQYVVSPFTEKVRRVLTYKNLKWNPIECHYSDKANLLKVTGGKWTRVPVLEWDGEVVFNSIDIIKWLDRKVPNPVVIPDDSRGLCDLIDHWADNIVFAPVMFMTIPDLLDSSSDEALKANRQKLIGLTTAQMRAQIPASRDQLRAYCAMIDSQLANRDFFLGKVFTVADASLYHPFFFLNLNAKKFVLVDEFRNLKRWYQRVRDIS
jgi:glutathione S-transferase